MRDSEPSAFFFFFAIHPARMSTLPPYNRHIVGCGYIVQNNREGQSNRGAETTRFVK